MESKGPVAKEVGGQSEFLRRLFALPVICAALNLVTNAYQNAKKSIRVFGKVADMAEGGWRLALGYADPVIHQLAPIAAAPLSKVDNLASKGLETLERSVPAIKKQPSEMVSDTKLMISNTMSPAVESLNKVSGTVLTSRPAQLSLDVVEKILSSGTTLVNNVLPSEKVAGEAAFPHEKAPDNKAARASWLFRESFFLVVNTTQRVFGMAHSQVDSAVHKADSMVNSVRKTL